MMKRVVSWMLIVAFVLGSVPVVSAQEAPAKPNMFPTMDACQTALKSGNFRYYDPKYFGLKSQNPVNGEDRVPVKLETDMCLKLCVVGGKQFVVQREGTPFRAYKRADGSLEIYARDDCGNCAEGKLFPQEQRAVVQGEPTPTTTSVAPPQVVVNQNVTVRDQPGPPQGWGPFYVDDPEGRKPPKKGGGWKKWVIIGGALVGGWLGACLIYKEGREDGTRRR